MSPDPFADAEVVKVHDLGRGVRVARAHQQRDGHQQHTRSQSHGSHYSYSGAKHNYASGVAH
jgi:hypothetical protein